MPASKTKEGANCTEQRRRLCLWVLWVHGPQNIASLTKLLRAHIESGRIGWPEAPWPNAAPAPYGAGIAQLVRPWTGEGRPLAEALHNGCRCLTWNPVVLTPRPHAEDVRKLAAKGCSYQGMTTILGISRTLAHSLATDPFGLGERERKQIYCGACGAKKDPEQTICSNCVRKKRLEAADRAESLLPDPEWARGVGARLAAPVDFCVTTDYERVIVIHTERGDVEEIVHRGETWPEALKRSGAMT